MKNKLLTDSFCILLANGITFISSMVVTKVFSSFFSLYDYGIRSEIIMVAALMTSIFGLGISNAAPYFVPISKPENRAGVIRNIYIMTVVSCSICCVAVFFAGNEIEGYFGETGCPEWKYMVSLISCEQIIYGIYSGIQVSLGRPLRATIVNLCKGLMSVVTVTVLCIFRIGIIYTMFGLILLDGMFCFLTVWDAIKSQGNIKGWFDPNLVYRMIIYCIPLGISVVMGTLCAQIDKMFVSRLLTFEELAIYTNMSSELPLAAISGAFIAVVTPYVVKLVDQVNYKAAVQIWNEVTELSAIILLPIITIMFIFAKPMISLLYSDAYLDGYVIFRMFVILEVSRITYFGLILKACGKSQFILACAGIALVANIVLNAFFFFALDMGLVGFATATILSTFFALFLELIFSCRISKTSFRYILPWGRLAKVVSINIGLGVIAYFVFGKLRVYYKDCSYILFAVLVLYLVIYLVIVSRRLRRIYRATLHFGNPPQTCDDTQ